MSNVHGLYSGKKKDEDEESDDENNRFVGGIGDRGGGSGLAVRPNPGDEIPDSDALIGLAEQATAEDQGQVRRTITMYRDGFVVDDGPYRRLDDPANAEFLRSLARGQTPRELVAAEGEEDVVVGLVDKRNEDYVPVFQSFSGTGTSLGVQNTSTDGTFDPAVLIDSSSSSSEPFNADAPSTSIQVRLLNGQRKIIKINLSQTVTDLARQLAPEAASQSFRLVSGFPPKPIVDLTATIEGAGLKGAQVTMQKA